MAYDLTWMTAEKYFGRRMLLCFYLDKKPELSTGPSRSIKIKKLQKTDSMHLCNYTIIHEN